MAAAMVTPAPIMTTSNASSPMSQTPPSSGVSPTNYHVRHIRAPRQPMYVPAALRPPEYPTRPTNIPFGPRAPDTPPVSKDSSFDSGKGATRSGTASPTLSKKTTIESAGSPTPAIDAASWEELRRGLSRAASDALDDALEYDGDGDDSTLATSVTSAHPSLGGEPTSAHWKPDAAATGCAVCSAPFTWFARRRHHCRRCGNVVCADHSAALVPLDLNARFHPRGRDCRACDPCAAEWRVVMQLRVSRASSLAAAADPDAPPSLPIPRSQTRVAEEARVGSMARSEGGMIWSTF